MKKGQRYQHTKGIETQRKALVRICELLEKIFPQRALDYSQEKHLLFLDGQQIKVYSRARSRSRPSNNMLFYRSLDGEEKIEHIQSDWIYILIWLPAVSYSKKYPEMIFVIKGEDLIPLIPSDPRLGVYPHDLEGFRNNWEILE